VDVSLETQALLARSVELEKALSELEVQRSELKQRFTETHPVLVTLNDQMDQFSRERAAIEQRFKKLPQAEMDSARLIRDAKVANELYVMLLNKSQELRVVKSGTVGNVRILDSAIVPVEPVSPKKPQTLALSLVLGLALGVGLAFVKRALTRGVEDPEAIERETGLAIYASIPRSTAEARLAREHDFDRVLAVVEPDDPAIESFRSLHTSLQFALVEAPNRIISVVGPAPGVGKSFVSANLAAVLAEAGNRVLVIDADLRKGRLHKYFGGGRENGLSELISGTKAVEAAIRSTVSPNVDFVACGTPPPNPVGLLASERFGAVLSELQSRYDFVVIDTAPVLAVTDAVRVARHSGVNLMVLRAGKHPIREINAALRRFEQGGVQVHGAVLNDVQVRMGYAAGYHYQYAYSSNDKKDQR
jgi:tyrosine-protein kinase Etk/Wzc